MSNVYARDFIQFLSESEKIAFMNELDIDEQLSIVMGWSNWLHFDRVLDICEKVGINYFKETE